jgi:Ala-tRNA(Pro) deacylase
MNVELLLRRHGMSFTKTVHPPTFSSQRLAAEAHTPGRNIAKPVLVRVGPTYVLCVVPANRRVDLDALARAMNAASAQLAGEHELAQVFPDCELGAEPPFGRPYGIPTVMDTSLREDEYVVFQAGSHTEAVKMLRADYERVAEPITARIARD